eukprot:g30317.t1
MYGTSVWESPGSSSAADFLFSRPQDQEVALLKRDHPTHPTQFLEDPADSLKDWREKLRTQPSEIQVQESGILPHAFGEHWGILKALKTTVLLTGGLCSKLFGIGLMGYLAFQSMQANVSRSRQEQVQGQYPYNSYGRRQDSKKLWVALLYGHPNEPCVALTWPHPQALLTRQSMAWEDTFSYGGHSPVWSWVPLSVVATCALFLSVPAAQPADTINPPPVIGDGTGWVLPHLVDRIPPPPIKYIPGTGAVIARVYIMFEVRTNDWHYMKKRLSNRLAAFLDTPPLVPIVVGERCIPGVLLCRDLQRNVYLRAPGLGGASMDGDLYNTEPRHCRGADASKSGSANWDSVQALVGSDFNPQWRDDLDLLEKDDFCVSQLNTSLMLFPTPINNTYITGWRYDSKRRTTGNLVVAGNQERGVPLELHIVGVIPTKWARYFNAKFILNGALDLFDINLPPRGTGDQRSLTLLDTQKLVDTTAVFTDELNVTLGIFGVRQKEGGIRMGILDYLPVCLDPPVEARGCFRSPTHDRDSCQDARIDHKIYDDNLWNEYNFKNAILWQRDRVLEGLSEYNYPFGDWNATEGPWPSYDWYGLRMVPEECLMLLQSTDALSGKEHLCVDGEDPGVRYLGPWAQYTFPQKEYSLDQQSFCQTGSNCSEIPVAPSPRYLHTAVLYYTWNFWQHAHP